VTDASAVARLVETLEERSALPTILVNNAGITRDNLLVRMDPKEWDEVIATNLTGLFRMSRVIARHMLKAKRGRIINVASVVGAMGNAGQVNYAAAKAGIMGFTKALARELGGRGITVNAVAPGFIDTDMTRALPDAQRERLLQQIPLARLGAPREVAAAVTFLASRDAGYITGITLHVNGGLYMS
jgi:3-oxoacyl-[acyl-carrier protein] reductase